MRLIVSLLAVAALAIATPVITDVQNTVKSADKAIQKVAGDETLSERQLLVGSFYDRLDKVLIKLWDRRLLGGPGAVKGTIRSLESRQTGVGDAGLISWDDFNTPINID